MDTVRLKNGAEEVCSLVAVMMMQIDHIIEERPMALYDLAMKCRDRDYQFSGDNEDHLIGLEIVDPDGGVRPMAGHVPIGTQ